MHALAAIVFVKPLKPGFQIKDFRLKIKAWFSSMTPTNRRFIVGTQRIFLVSNQRQWNSPTVRVIWKPGSPILEIGQEDALIGQDNMQLQLLL